MNINEVHSQLPQDSFSAGGIISSNLEQQSQQSALSPNSVLSSPSYNADNSTTNDFVGRWSAIAHGEPSRAKPSDR